MKPTSFLFFLFLSLILSSCDNPEKKLKPTIKGDWWQVAGDPDLGPYTTPEQQPVDFGIWQAADGTWQLWSCIRHTACGGNTRLFYRWEGQSLTDPNWEPMGIAMEADTTLGEHLGGLQAPHVILVDGTYYMFYGGWAQICLATSQDGKNFQRVINEEGTTELFTGPYTNTRDPMVVRIGDLYYCYYMGHSKGAKYESAIFARTSSDLFEWSESTMVSAGGQAATMSDWWGGDAECPFVLKIGEEFVLFRNQVYGEDNLNTQYASVDPMDFGVGDDQYLIGTLPIAAPEIILHQGEYFVAALMPSLKGIRIARLDWVTRDP